MSEEKKSVKAENKAENKPQGKPAKVLQWFKTLPQRIAKPFKNMYYELKKVTWPSKEKLISYSLIVLAFMLVMGVVIGLLDMGASAGVRLLIPNSTTAQVEVAEPVDEATEEVAETAETATDEAVAETAETAESATEEAVAETAETVEAAVEEAAAETAETTETESTETNGQ